MSGAEYSAALEFGTKDGRIEERPFLRPAYEDNIEKITEQMKLEIAKAVR